MAYGTASQQLVLFGGQLVAATSTSDNLRTLGAGLRSPLTWQRGEDEDDWCRL